MPYIGIRGMQQTAAQELAVNMALALFAFAAASSAPRCVRLAHGWRSLWRPRHELGYVANLAMRNSIVRFGVAGDFLSIHLGLTHEAAAKAELANPKDADARISTGDCWWAAFESIEMRYRIKHMSRAAYWYEQVVKDTSGAVKVRIEKRLAQQNKAKPKPSSMKPSVSFSRQIAPTLVIKCGRCHVNNARGMVSMASFASLIKGSPKLL